MPFYGQQFCLVLLIISDLFFKSIDWNWSWDELVAYDLPVTFKYVHDLTGQKLHYVGHAQVNFTFYAAEGLPDLNAFAIHLIKENMNKLFYSH